MLPLLQTRLHHNVINIRLLKHRKHPELLAMFIRLVEHLVKVGIQRVTKKSLLRHVDLSNGIQRVTKKSVFRHVDLEDGIQRLTKSVLRHVDLDDGIQKKSFLPHLDLDDGIQRVTKKSVLRHLDLDDVIRRVMKSVLRHLHLNNTPAVRFNEMHQLLLPCTRDHIAFQALLHHRATRCLQESFVSQTSGSPQPFTR